MFAWRRNNRVAHISCMVGFVVGGQAMAWQGGPVNPPPTWGQDDGNSTSLFFPFDGPHPYTPAVAIGWPGWGGATMEPGGSTGDPGETATGRRGVQGITMPPTPGQNRRGTLMITIQNRAGDDESRKDFWFQYDRYSTGPGAFPLQFGWEFPPSPPNPRITRTQEVFEPEVDLGNGWRRVTGHLSFTPQPAWEKMTIFFNIGELGGTVAIDNLAIHTHCIPGPASLALLGTACLVGARRRRTVP